ncbi:MAG: ABC transporter ATP-binding protein/permease [Neomegalonema sp.]|nr:ABC transporter ATP-binding protein/permease [Neomegalonema sp.]
MTGSKTPSTDDPRARARGFGFLARALLHWCDPFDPRTPQTPPRRLGAFFLWAYRGFGWPILGVGVSTFFVGVTEVVILAGVGELVDRARASPPEAFFAANSDFLLFMAGLILIGRPLVLALGSIFGAMVIGPNLYAGVLWRLHRYVLGHSIRYFDDDFAGRLAQKEAQAGGAVETVTMDLLMAVGVLGSFLIGMTVVLSLADWRLGLFAVLWGVGYFLVLWRMLPKVRRLAKERAEARSAVTGLAVDSLSNIKTVKMFAAPGQEESAARVGLSRYRHAAFHVGATVTLLRTSLNMLNGIAMTALLGVALWLWSSGAATLGAVAAAAAMTFRLSHMSNWIAFTLLGVFRELGTLEDAVATLAAPHELHDRPNALHMRAPAAMAGAADRIVIEDVSFSYHTAAGERRSAFTSPGPAALRNLSLTIDPGEKVGLVGPSGAGKSTLTALLLRLYEPGSGRISIGGADISAVAASDLRARFGVVTQEPALFNRSARDNIRYGRPEAVEAEVHEAARRAHAHEFILGLRDIKGRSGYDAHLGERGVKLSGGQRQRVALARVFLKKAPILVLDEATSALDSEVEAAILETMGALMEGKTVIAIAHRLSTLAEMDRIVVLDGGGVVEEGPHAQLMKRGGLYARLWSRQSGGFLGVDAAAE